jgi:hypothetical protein
MSFSDGSYNWERAALRRVSAFYLGSALETDAGFLKYCKIHIDKDGTKAQFTPSQVERARSLGLEIIGEYVKPADATVFEATGWRAVTGEAK